jgi:hypothetical protein
MDADAFLARVREYDEAGWRLAIINVTTVVGAAAPAHGAHGAAVAPAAVAPAQAPVQAPAQAPVQAPTP